MEGGKKGPLRNPHSGYQNQSISGKNIKKLGGNKSWVWEVEGCRRGTEELGVETSGCIIWVFLKKGGVGGGE